MSRPERRAAQRSGQRAERLAALWLRLKGYRVLARGFRTPVGEIDLVVRRGRTLAFVEVKRRDDLGVAAQAIGDRQRQRVRRAAEAFLKRRPDLQGCDLRFDAFLLSPGRLPQHILDAWT